MSRPVYVLGAGFCKDFSARFPLLSELLSTAEHDGIYKPTSTHQHLGNIIFRYFHSFTPKDFEKVMSFLAVAPIHGRLELENRSYLYEQLTRIVGRVLARALEPQALERSEAGE